MRLLVVGHGRMGSLVEGLAPSYGFEVAGIAGAHFQDQAGIAGHRVHLLDLGEGLQLHHPRTLAPARRVDMDEGEQRLAHRLAVEAGGRGLDHPGLAQPLDPLVHGRCRQPDLFAQRGIADGGVGRQYAQDFSVERVEHGGISLIRLNTACSVRE